MKSFLDLVKLRRSVRRYSGRVPSRDVLDRCVEAARLAPSACNSQPWTFIVVDEPALREKVARATFNAAVSFNRFVLNAAALVVVVAESSNPTAQVGAWVKNRQFNLLDVGIAVEHFCLEAADEGLGTCILGWFEEKKIKKLLGIPRSKRIGLCIAAGYPEDEDALSVPGEKKRKDSGTMSAYNGYPE